MRKITKCDLTCIACPVQLEGETDDGNVFYFRARHNMWELLFGDYPDVDALIVGRMNNDSGIQSWIGNYQTHAMDANVARRIVTECLT